MRPVIKNAAKAARLLVVATAMASCIPLVVHSEEHGKSHSMDKAQLPVKVSDIEITGYWTRAMLPGQPAGGGFMTITNSGSQDDVLRAMATSAAGRGEIHTMEIVDGVMRMRELGDGLTIPAGESVELKPGSYHLMFLEVIEPFKEGTSVPVSLEFEKAGKVEIVLPVLPFNYGRSKMQHGKHHQGMKHEN